MQLPHVMLLVTTLWQAVSTSLRKCVFGQLVERKPINWGEAAVRCVQHRGLLCGQK